MITYWQQIDGQFTKTRKEEINTKLPLWVDARNVTRDETTLLQEEYQIEQDHILDVLDPDELSRIIFLQLSVFLFMTRQQKLLILPGRLVFL